MVTKIGIGIRIVFEGVGIGLNQTGIGLVKSV